jgi:hypothetical protein
VNYFLKVDQCHCWYIIILNYDEQCLSTFPVDQVDCWPWDHGRLGKVVSGPVDCLFCCYIMK